MPLLAALATLLLLLAPARAAEPPTLAVLPLGRAAASEQYDGLGKALAGMLVSDLAAVPALRLVERERLDALLAEMKLAETGFLDPATAQELGRGSGARFVLTGSFSVVGETFLMDARVVEVETGTVVKAADESGTVADFVAVEKALVEGLLDGLAVTLSAADRRRLMLQAPTERFDAFAAYGEGLARRDQGRLDEAKAAFERAVRADPAFEAAQAELRGLRDLVVAAKAAQAGAAKEVADAAHAHVLAEVPDERTRAKGFADTPTTLAAFAIRLAVLESERRDCDRYEEMLHYLDRVGWRVAHPPREPGQGVFGHVVWETAKAYGLDAVRPGADTPEHLRDTAASRAGPLFDDTVSFVMSGQANNPWKRSHGVYGAIQGCFPPADQLRRIDQLLARARATGAAALTDDGHPPNLTLAEHLDLAWAWTRAKHLGADAELRRRTGKLLEGRKDDEAGARLMLVRVEDVLRLAERWEESEARKLGLGDEAIVAAMRGLATADPAVVHAGTPMCAALAKEYAPRAKAWVARYEAGAGSETGLRLHVDQAGIEARIARDLGCIAGEPARFEDYAAVLAFARAARDRPDPEHGQSATCLQMSGNLDAVDGWGEIVARDPSTAPLLARQTLAVVYGLASNRCIMVDR